MKGPTVAMTLVLVVAGVTALPLAGLAQPGDPLEATADALRFQGNETAETPPGARLSAVVGAQEAEVRGEIEGRSFDVALERAPTDEARARIVERRAREIEQRVDDLRERKRTLRQARRNGTITTATYVAELTALAARSESARGLANQTHAAARGLPADVAERRGINVTAIGELERRAAELTGPEAARIARSIAGPAVGRPVGAGPPDHAGPPGNASGGPPGNASAGPPGDDVGRQRGDGSPGAPNEAGSGANESVRGAAGSDAANGPGTGADDAGDANDTAPAGASGATDGANATAGDAPVTDDRVVLPRQRIDVDETPVDSATARSRGTDPIEVTRS